MLLNIKDLKLPALDSFDQAMLSSITERANVELLRFRYRPGKRAVLHIAANSDRSSVADEGVIWFFAGDKGRRLARKHPGSFYHESTGALYESFPQDHRLPELSSFVTNVATMANEYIGCELITSPKLERYRPGISATFSCRMRNGKLCFGKVIAGENVSLIAEQNAQLSTALSQTGVSVAQVRHSHPAGRIIVYEAAAGTALDDLLGIADSESSRLLTRRTVLALRRLSSVNGLNPRLLGRKALLARAQRACEIIRVTDTVAGELAEKLFQRMQSTTVVHRTQLIHGDMKPEHVFMTDDQVTFIDTESLSLGDPDYDLSKLEARMVAAHLMGNLNKEKLDVICDELRRFVTMHYHWYLDAAVLQTAKFFAQRPGQGNSHCCQLMLQWPL